MSNGIGYSLPVSSINELQINAMNDPPPPLVPVNTKLTPVSFLDEVDL